MPMIRVEMFAGRSHEQKQAFAKAVTENFVKICGGSPESVQIIFSDVAKENWATAGTLAGAPSAIPAKSA
jgi:4-oxalocrotonate tautomerase